MRSIINHNRGFGLIESLIALLVIAFGAIAISRLNLVTLGGSGEAKIRSDATQLAQEKMEELRNTVLKDSTSYSDDFTDQLGTAGNNMDPNNPFIGVNEKYGRKWSVTPLTTPADRTEVKVCVAWPYDSTKDPCSGTDYPTNKVVLVSQVAWGRATTVTSIATGEEHEGNFIKTPTGRAEIGRGETYTGGETGVSNNDGTKIVKDSTDKMTYLVDETTGEIILQISWLEGEDSDSTDNEFSIIRGKVYIDQSANLGISVADVKSDLFILPSDASACTRVFSDTSGIYPSTDDDSFDDVTGSHFFVYNSTDEVYDYFKYNCYFGAGWWGNIGIADRSTGGPAKRICQGDPTVTKTVDYPAGSPTDSFDDYQDYPALSITRAFRGAWYNGSVYETVGLGISVDGSGDETYTPQTPLSGQYDYLITRITGNAADSDCKIPEEQPSAATNPFRTTNAGEFVCFTPNEDPDTCLNVGSTYEPATTVIYGTITKLGTDTLDTIAGENCASLSVFPNASANLEYSCTINWDGFAGAEWEDTLISFSDSAATSTATLCASGVSVTSVPTGSVAYTINDTSHPDSPNSLQFTNVATGIEEIELNFNMLDGTCGTLGQPAPTWPASPSGLVPLTWNPITDATYYQVYTCALAGDNSRPAPCDPLGDTGTLADSNNTSRSYTPTQPANKATVCISVVATDGTLSSAASSAKCLFFRNPSSYDYY